MGMHIYFYHILERLLKQPFPHKVIGCYCGEGSLPEYELVPWTALHKSAPFLSSPRNVFPLRFKSVLFILCPPRKKM